MKRICFLVLVVSSFWFEGSKAQNNNALDEAAEAYVTQVSMSYMHIGAMKLSMTLNIHFPDNDMPEIQRWNVWVKDQYFKILMGKDNIISDGKSVWMYLADYEQVQISTIEDAELPFNPSELFTLYEKDYIYRMKEEYYKDARLYKIVEFAPSDKEQDFFKIDITVDDYTKWIHEIKIYMKSGESYLLTIDKMDPNVDIADDYFVFDEADYEDIEIIDLRE